MFVRIAKVLASRSKLLTLRRGRVFQVEVASSKSPDAPVLLLKCFYLRHAASLSLHMPKSFL